jgi:tRNA-uridine 2-sulfurtransferase
VRRTSVVAHQLGVPHYVVDEADRFERLVIDYFSSEYQAGRTPNPCVMCNELLKFGSLWSKAAALGAAYIATGHYAIIEHHPGGAVLRKGRDSHKDQSYFLFSLSPAQLSRALTPLGTMTKPEIRNIARELGLRVADKPDSQEICFVPGSNYKEFLRSHLGEKTFHRGGIYSLDGDFIGEHSGIELFTIGQRKGLPGGFSKPLYVVDIDPETRSVIVGGEEELVRDAFEVDRVNWLARRSEIPDKVTVKIRYAHPGTPARLQMLEGQRARVQLGVPQRAITPGQAAVFYEGDRVVGGGWIVRQPALAAA